MEIPDIPFDALSYTVVVVMFALPAVFPVSLVLLWVYLRAVKRSMLRRAVEEPLAKPAPPVHDASGQGIGPPERPLLIATVDAGAILGKWTATKRVWFAGVTHAIAGLAFAYVMGTVFLLASGLGFDWQVALGSAIFYTWPIVITLGLVCTVSWLGRGLLVLGYALALAATMAVLAAGTTITASQVASLWFALNRDGTLLALASLAPPIRAVGPLVAVFMIAIVAGAPQERIGVRMRLRYARALGVERNTIGCTSNGMSARERVAVLLQILGGPQRVTLAQRGCRSHNVLACSTGNPSDRAIASVSPLTRPASVAGVALPGS
jgi:hypothetical protein